MSADCYEMKEYPGVKWRISLGATPGAGVPCNVIFAQLGERTSTHYIGDRKAGYAAIHRMMYKELKRRVRDRIP